MTKLPLTNSIFCRAWLPQGPWPNSTNILKIVLFYNTKSLDFPESLTKLPLTHFSFCRDWPPQGPRPNSTNILKIVQFYNTKSVGSPESLTNLSLTQYLLQSLTSPRSLTKLYKHPQNDIILQYKEFRLPKVLDKTPTNTLSFAELDLPKVLDQTLQTSSK